MADISKIILPSNNEYNLKDAIHRADKNNPHEVTAKQIGAKSIEPDYRISGAAGWYRFLVVPVESNRSRKIVLRLVESYNTTGVAIVSIYLNRRSDGSWAATNGYITSSTIINNTDIGLVLNEQDNEVEFYYRKRSGISGRVLVTVLESIARTGGLVDLSENFETTPVSEFPSNGTYFYPSQDGAGNFIPTTYATKAEVNELDAEDVGAVPDTELNGTTATASGAVASFETASAQVLPSVVVNIDLVQAGSGDPSPTNTRLISGWENCQVWVQPEYDSSATPTKTISLGRTVYGGTLDVLRGKLTVDKAITMLQASTSYITTGTTSGGVNYASVLYSGVGITLGGNIKVQSSNYVWSSTDATAVEGMIKCYEANFRIYDSRFTSKESAKAILDNVQVVYPLEQPIEYDVDASIITAFSGQNAVWADTGNISVTYRTGKFALLSDEANAVEISKALIDSKTAKDIPYDGIVGGFTVTNVAAALDFQPKGSNTTPLMDGVGSAGIADGWSRSDHKHPSDTSRVPIYRQINGKQLNSDLVLYWPSEIVLSLSWSGNGPWTQSDPEMMIPSWSGGISSNSSITLRPTAAQISQLITDGVTALTVENNNGTLIVYAFGATPSTAMTIACTVMEVSV